jgi:hypothetical protein
MDGNLKKDEYLDQPHLKSDENQNDLPEEKLLSVESGSEEKPTRNRRTPAQWFRKYFLEGEFLTYLLLTTCCLRPNT